MATENLPAEAMDGAPTEPDLDNSSQDNANEIGRAHV